MDGDLDMAAEHSKHFHHVSTDYIWRKWCIIIYNGETEQRDEIKKALKWSHSKSYDDLKVKM